VATEFRSVPSQTPGFLSAAFAAVKAGRQTEEAKSWPIRDGVYIDHSLSAFQIALLDHVVDNFVGPIWRPSSENAKAISDVVSGP
jgi:hypothetical protein